MMGRHSRFSTLLYKPLQCWHHLLKGFDITAVVGEKPSSATTTAFRDGSIDAAIANTAAPAPFVVDLETTHPVKLISLTDEEIHTFSEEFPYYVPATISQNSYNTLDSDVSTFAVWITLVGQKSLPEETVYDVVKTIFENQEALKDVHVVAEHITLDNVEKITGVPFHKGAIKYYEENGITVPEDGGVN